MGAVTLKTLIPAKKIFCVARLVMVGMAWERKEGMCVVRPRTHVPTPRPVLDLSAKLGSVSSTDVLYADKGRKFNMLTKEMPAFGQKGGLTEQQVKDVVAFLNKGPKIGEFATLDISSKPVSYTFKKPDLEAGKNLYKSNCASCHNEDGNGEDMSLKKYFSGDGKYSEGYHKAVYGAGGKSEMTREAMGNLSGKQIADILANIQANF